MQEMEETQIQVEWDLTVHEDQEEGVDQTLIVKVITRLEGTAICFCPT